MLTDRKLTETALRIVNEQLADLAIYDRTEQVDKALCADHCPTGDCIREEDGFGVEIRAVHREIKGAVAFLRDQLAVYAAKRDIAIPTEARGGTR